MGKRIYFTEEDRRAARVAAVLKNRQKKGKEAYNTYTKERNRKVYPELRDAVINKLGSKCNKCGYDADSRALQIDHIDGQGRRERRTIGWSKFYNKILIDTTNYQLLCANCNYIKRYDNEEVYIADNRLKSNSKSSNTRNTKPALDYLGAENLKEK